MNLAESQRILARLVTDSALRDRFRADAHGVADSEGWDAESARGLATIPPDRLRHYGESLVNKRWREAAGWLPLTFKVLGDTRFRDLFRQYAGRPTPRGPAQHREDAIAFAGMLQRARPEASGHPPWLDDLAAYEATSLRAGKPGRGVVFLRLDHLPRDLMQAAHSGDSAAQVRRRPALIAWVRFTRTGPRRRFTLPRS